MIETLQKIQSELKAPKNQYNSFGKYNYRSCEDILEALKGVLAKHAGAVIISDEMVAVGDRLYVKATVTIHCGDKSVTATAFAREGDNKKGMDDAQLTGATSSYARKYALNGLLCIDDTKDADATNEHGNNTQQNTNNQKPKKEDKGWFNEYPQYNELKTLMLNKLISGETKSTDDIIRGLTGDGWKINKEVRELIKGLAVEAAAAQ